MKPKIAVAVSSAFLLSACNLFSGSGSEMSAAAEADMSTYFAQRLAAGRAHLANGRPTMAITAFRQASYDPAFAAEAYNGMGVAYARIGREDVAQHFFTEASLRAPGDQRYARNLARLEAQLEMLAARQAAPTTEQAIAKALEGAVVEAIPAAARPADVGTGANSGLVRVSKHEVRLTSAPAPQAEKVATGPAAVTVTTGADRSYPVRVQVTTPQGQAKTRTYPVRVSLAPTS